MKKNMVVVSLKAVANDTMEIGLVPVAEPKKKKTLMDIALNGDLTKVINEVQTAKQRFMDIIYRPLSWCIEHEVTIYKQLCVEVSPDE